jgi:hypothetical protein
MEKLYIMSKNKVMYEWDFIYVDENEDIQEHDFYECLSECSYDVSMLGTIKYIDGIKCIFQLCLNRIEYTDEDGVKYKDYLDIFKNDKNEWVLPEYFEEACQNVPKHIVTEFTKWTLINNE